MPTAIRPSVTATNFLEQLETATTLDDAQKKALVAEVRFLRAFDYFTLVKRYGGVPLLSNTQAYDPSHPETLQVPRNKEVEVYDYIVNECRAAATDLPVKRDDANKYRATQGAALALLSRAGSLCRLYRQVWRGAGSMAWWVFPLLTRSASSRLSYDASKEIIDSHAYSLYQGNSNKSQNFCDLFTKTVNGNNGEYIFQKQFDVAANKGHDWDKRNAPFSYRGGGWGCGIAPTLELVEAFEYVDGSKGTLKAHRRRG